MPRVLTTTGEELGFVDGLPPPGSEVMTSTDHGERRWIVVRQVWRIVGQTAREVGRCVAVFVREPEPFTVSKPRATAAHAEATPALRVLFDRVLVTTIKPDEGALRGVVRAVGPAVTDVGIGEIVFFGKYSGITVCLPGVDADPCRPCRVLRQDEILFVVEKL